MAATTPSPSLSRTGKISYLCDFLEIRRNYDCAWLIYLEIVEDCSKLENKNSDSEQIPINEKSNNLIAQRLVIKLQQPE